MQIDALDSDYAFLRLDSGTQPGLDAEWSSGLASLLPRIGSRWVIVETPLGFFTSDLSGSKTLLKLHGATPGAAIRSANRLLS